MSRTQREAACVPQELRLRTGCPRIRRRPTPTPEGQRPRGAWGPMSPRAPGQGRRHRERESQLAPTSAGRDGGDGHSRVLCARDLRQPDVPRKRSEAGDAAEVGGGRPAAKRGEAPRDEARCHVTAGRSVSPLGRLPETCWPDSRAVVPLPEAQRPWPWAGSKTNHDGSRTSRGPSHERPCGGAPSPRCHLPVLSASGSRLLAVALTGGSAPPGPSLSWPST